jgi:hypothetical protein
MAPNDMSDLETEFELEMEGDEESASYEGSDELESLPSEEAEADEELEDLDREGSEYADRLFELSQREFESESELDSEVQQVLNEIEQDFFFKNIRNKWKKFKKGALGKLVSKGLSLAKSQIPAFQALKGVTSLARGDLKGLLGSLVKTGISSAIPGGGVALDALKNLGFKETEAAEDNREAWGNVVSVAQEAYEHLANNMTDRADDPLEATRLAADAFRAGLRKNGRARGRTYGGGFGLHGKRRRIRIRRGEVLVIECL